MITDSQKFIVDIHGLLGEGGALARDGVYTRMFTFSIAPEKSCKRTFQFRRWRSELAELYAKNEMEIRAEHDGSNGYNRVNDIILLH